VRSRLLSLLLLAGLAACADAPVSPDSVGPRHAATGALHGLGRVIQVTSADDAGAGTLRAALAAADADPEIQMIELSSALDTIVLQSGLTFDGPQPLVIDGRGTIIDAAALPAGRDALTLGLSIAAELRDLTVRRAPGTGISMLVSPRATGTVQVVLDGVRVIENGSHGVLINDQVDYLTDPDATTNGGSDANLRVTVRGSLFRGNGFAAIDRDGLRVNEGGLGDLVAEIVGTVVERNGGDGIELDERGAGDASFVVRGTDLLFNGAFTPDDFDDGIDVDEADAGHLVGHFERVRANDNFEQGIDLNENHAGDLKVTMRDVQGSRNAEEGIEFEEDDDFAGGGSLYADLADVVANGNGAVDGDAGLKLREKGDGDVEATLLRIRASDNAVRGIELREDAAGAMLAFATDITADRNAGEGVRLDENGAGDLLAKVVDARTVDNGEAGIHAEQQTAGSGTLVVVGHTAAGNPDGSVEADPRQVSVTILP